MRFSESGLIMTTETVISQYFQHTPKRKAPTSTSSESPSPDSHQDPKKQLLHESFESMKSAESGRDPESVTVMDVLSDIKRQMGGLATKSDFNTMKTDFEKLANKVTERMEKMEARIFDVEKSVDAFKAENSSLRDENAELKGQVRRQEQKTKKVVSDQNDLEQYNRRWNIRVYNMPEQEGETSEDCTKKCCRLFTELIGVSTTEEDLEAAHRTGPLSNRKRPIIVRFQSKKLRDKVLGSRKKLKGKKMSVDEDLTSANYKLARDIFKHSSTIASWSSNGKIIAKLKNGKTVRVPFGCDIDAFFQKEMSA